MFHGSRMDQVTPIQNQYSRNVLQESHEVQSFSAFHSYFVLDEDNTGE